MKRYLLFAGNRYYPSGGWEDFRGDFDTVSEAEANQKAIQDNVYPDGWWWHVIDSRHKVEVAQGTVDT